MFCGESVCPSRWVFLSSTSIVWRCTAYFHLSFLITAPAERSHRQLVPPNWSSWGGRRGNHSARNHCPKNRICLARVQRVFIWSWSIHRLDNVVVCSGMDCLCNSFYSCPISKNQIFNGMVGFYVSPWYVIFVWDCADSGTFASCSTQLGKTLSLDFFKIASCIVTVCVILLWLLVALRTVIDGWKGQIFYAPCLGKIGDSVPEVPELVVPPLGLTTETK